MGLRPSFGLPACHSAICHTNRLGVQSLQSSDHLKVPHCSNFNFPFRPLPSTNPSSTQGHVPATPFVVVPLSITWTLQTIDAFCRKLRGQWFIADDSDHSATYQGRMSEAKDEMQGSEYCNYTKPQICCDSATGIWWALVPKYYKCSLIFSQNQKYFINPNWILFAVVLQANLYTVQIMQWKHAIP